jgi:hypothetical protein
MTRTRVRDTATTGECHDRGRDGECTAVEPHGEVPPLVAYLGERVTAGKLTPVREGASASYAASAVSGSAFTPCAAS